MTVPMHDPKRRYIRGSSSETIFTYVQYGSFRFPAAVSLKFSVEPIYDSSNRVPKWHKHTFTIETVIDPTTSPMGDSKDLYPVDLNMSQVRRWLSIPGQRLIFWNLGVGQNQRINTSAYESHPTGATGVTEPANGSAATIKQDPTPDLPNSNNYSFVVDNNTDLDFGPKPRLLACECIGGSRAFRIVWTVECALPICCVQYSQSDGFVLCNSPDHFNGPYRELFANVLTNDLKITEFNYSLSWEIDDARFTNFNIVGSVEFSGLLVNIGDSGSDSGINQTLFTGAVLDSGKVIDALAAAFYLRPGFNRSIQWDISRDKRRLDFRITDREIPSDQPFYPGIKDCKVQHSIQGSPLKRLWTMNFTADYELQPGVAKFWGLVAFIALLQDRLQFLTLALIETKDNKADELPDGKAWIMPINFSFNEDIYSRKMSFDFSFQLCCRFKDLFSATRMFANAPGSWLAHRTYLTPQTLDLKGTAQIRTLSHEPLITACRYPEVFTDVTQTWFKPGVNAQYPLLEPKCPPEDKSILYYTMTSEVQVTNELVPMKPAFYSGPKATTHDYGQEKNTQQIPDLVITPDNDNSSLATTPSLQAWLANTQGEELYSSGDSVGIKTQTNMTSHTVVATPEVRIIFKGGIASVCHQTRAPAIIQIKTKYSMSDEEGSYEPLQIEEEIVEGPTQLNLMSQIPIYMTRFYYVGKVNGYPMGSIKINMNGEYLEGEINKTMAQKFNPSGVDGMNLGNLEQFLNQGIPTLPHGIPPGNPTPPPSNAS